MRNLGIAVALFATVVLTACSPYVYDKEIGAFSQGVGNLSASYNRGRLALTATAEAQQRDAFISARTPVDLSNGCDQMNARGDPPKFADCQVMALGAAAASDPDVVTIIDRAAPAFTALKAYTDALSDVTNATDDKSLKLAGQRLADSLGGLTGAAAKLNPSLSKFRPVASGGANLLTAGFDLYLDSRRYTILKTTVPSVDKSVEALGRVAEAALKTLRAVELQYLEAQLHRARDALQGESISALSKSDYANKLAELDSDVAAFNQTRLADPHAAVAAMVDAHHKLAQALMQGEGQDDAVLAAAIDFAGAASQFDNTLKYAMPAAAKQAQRVSP